MPTYYTVITTVGLTRLAQAQMSGIPLVFVEFAVGDGNGGAITPSASMTELVGEVYRADVNQVTIHPSAPTTIRIEGLIPTATGGFTIREVGWFNGSGELIAVGSVPATYKSTPAEGATVDGVVRSTIEYSDVEAVALTVDGSIVTATVEDLENATAGYWWLAESFS